MDILLKNLGLTDYSLTDTEKNRIIRGLSNDLIIDFCEGNSHQILWSRGAAVFSKNHKYRFLLTRIYNHGTGTCVFIMLNPSTANESIDDPTTRRCVKFSSIWGFKRLIIVNLFAYRTAHPRLLNSIKDPVGSYNDVIIKSAIGPYSEIVLGWGNKGSMLNRSGQIQSILRSLQVKPMAFRLTSRGHPIHPLYIPSKASTDTVVNLRQNVD